MFYRRHKKEVHLILFFVVLKLLLHLLANSRFGFHRDELLYLALAEHLDWGYKEVPPFIAAIGWLGKFLFGDSIFASRLIPSICSSLIILLTGLMVMALNGKRIAIIVACCSLILSPAFLASGYLLQPVVFDQLFWVTAAFIIIKYIQTHQAKYIYLFGAVAGLGMLNKYTMAFFLFALFAGLLLTPQRKMLWNKRWLVAILIGLLIMLPNLVWQIMHGFPVLRHMKELKETQLDYISPLSFLAQNFMVHATAALIPAIGLVYYLVSKSNYRFRFLGFTFIVIILLLLLLQGKVYYGFGAFPMLFAAGAVCFEKIFKRIPTVSKSLILVLVSPCILLVPISIPLLPVEQTLQFFEFALKRTQITFPLKWEDQELHATTQDFADMFGWQEMAEYSAKAYQLVPPNERRNVTIFASNYGQAGAIDHLGKSYNIPKTVSLSSSYALWAPDEIETKYLIHIADDDTGKLSGMFKHVTKIGEVKHPLARERGTEIYLLAEPLKDVNEVYRAALTEARGF